MVKCLDELTRLAGIDQANLLSFLFLLSVNEKPNLVSSFKYFTIIKRRENHKDTDRDLECNYVEPN